VQHREYVRATIFRHIDWKGYGRSERYTIKQYEQETNFLGHVPARREPVDALWCGDTNKLE